MILTLGTIFAVILHQVLRPGEAERAEPMLVATAIVELFAWRRIGTDCPEHRRARVVGHVFQNPFSGTARSMTIAENLAVAARRGQRRALGWAVSRRSRAALRDCVACLGRGLDDRLDIPVALLSGGQRQAITLLMAVWTKPKLLLLDEHTAALDPRPPI